MPLPHHVLKKFDKSQNRRLGIVVMLWYCGDYKNNHLLSDTLEVTELNLRDLIFNLELGGYTMFSLRVTYAIQLLRELEQASRISERLSVTELRTRCALEATGVSYVLGALRRTGWVDQIRCKHFLIKDLTKATLYDLVIAMDDEIRLGTYCVMELWSPRNRDHHQVAIDIERQLTADVTERLKDILISDLFSCRTPQLRRTRTPRAVAAKKTTQARAE